jgi:hypothetical protein
MNEKQCNNVGQSTDTDSLKGLESIKRNQFIEYKIRSPITYTQDVPVAKSFQWTGLISSTVYK